jgi:hypothetical protein
MGEIMNNCSNCKHWEFPRVKSWGNDVTYGECRAVLHNDNYKFDPYPDEDEDNDPDTFNIPLACVVDGSGYYAGLRTKSDFSCCLHERKES